MYGPQKGHFLIIFDQFFRNFSVAVVGIVVAIVIGPEKLLELAPVFLVMVVGPVIQLFNYLFTTYEITDDMLVVKKEFINKTRKEIPLETITTVDLTQNVLYQACKVQRIQVENTVQIKGKGQTPNTVLALSTEDAQYFKELLLSKKKNRRIDKGSEEAVASSKKGIVGNLVESMTNDPDYRAGEDDFDVVIKPGLSEFLILGLLQSKAVIFIIVVSCTLTGGGLLLESKIFGEKANSVMEAMTITQGLVGIGIVLVALYLLTLVGSIGISLVKHLEFTIKKDPHAIYVNYGLLSKKKFSLANEKITGIAMKQSLLMRVFGYYTLEIHAIGYGDVKEDGSKASAILYPIGKKEKLEKVLEQALPTIKVEQAFSREKKGTLHYFFYSPMFFWPLAIFASIITAIIATNTYMTEKLAEQYQMLYTIGIVIAIVTLALGVAACILEYSNSAISRGTKTIGYINGSFTRTITLLKTDFVETVSWSSTTIKEKKKMGHLIIQSFGPLITGHAKVKNFRREDFDTLQKYIKY